MWWSFKFFLLELELRTDMRHFLSILSYLLSTFSCRIFIIAIVFLLSTRSWYLLSFSLYLFFKEADITILYDKIIQHFSSAQICQLVQSFMGSITNKERDNRLINVFSRLQCYGRQLVMKVLPHLIRGSLCISGVISGQVKLLIKQICNLKYDTGTLIFKQLISIPKSSMCLVFEEPLQYFYKNNTSGWLE